MLSDFLISIVKMLAGNWLNTFSNRDRLKVMAFWGHGINADGVGSFLCLHVKIINPGASSVYFERLEAVDKSGEAYYPLFYGVKVGTEVPPKRNIVGAVPCGHVVSTMPTELRVYDSTERCHAINGRRFKKAVYALATEKERLERLGFKVHPNESQRALQ